MIERKVARFIDLEVKADESGPGSFSGHAAIFNNVDDGGDVIIPGAFKGVIDEFVTRGFVPLNHRWMDLPIASIKSAKEDDRGLWIEADFHSNATAQEVRTVMAERAARGKFIGMSIGYLVNNNDPESVEFTDDGVRKLKRILELPESSITFIPMNREAEVVGVKAGQGAVPFTERAARVLADVEDFVDHVQRHVDMRADFKEGRVLSSANRERLAAIHSGLSAAAGDLGMILKEHDPERQTEKSNSETALEAFHRRELLRDVDLLLAEQ